jgi:hypothetical protein
MTMTTDNANQQMFQNLASALNGTVDGRSRPVKLFKNFLSQANLRPEQQTVAEFIIALMDDEPAVEIRPAPDDIDGGADAEEDHFDAPKKAPTRFQAVEAELQDLREANDTMAAALGACHLCWGGNEECTNCHGQGHTGYRPPDPALFNQLVLPAVRRVYGARKTSGRVYKNSSRVRTQ